MDLPSTSTEEAFTSRGSLGLRRQHHGATDDESGAHVLPGDLLIIIQLISGHDHLQILEAGAVIELDEPKGFHIPDGAGPAAHGDFLAVQLFLVGKKGAIFIRSIVRSSLH